MIYKLNIDSQEIPINQKLIFLQGNYDINTIENLPYSWVDWDENLELLFSDSNLMIEFFSHLNFIITQQNSKKTGLISDNWNNLYSTFEENKNNIAEYLSFFRMVNDYVEVRDGRIFNLAFDFDLYIDETNQIVTKKDVITYYGCPICGACLCNDCFCGFVTKIDEFNDETDILPDYD